MKAGMASSHVTSSGLPEGCSGSLPVWARAGEASTTDSNAVTMVNGAIGEGLRHRRAG